MSELLTQDTSIPFALFVTATYVSPIFSGQGDHSWSSGEHLKQIYQFETPSPASGGNEDVIDNRRAPRP